LSPNTVTYQKLSK